MNKVLAIIPARYASSRFPGKPLADIGGKTMIQRVHEQVSKSASIHKMIVATDDERILTHVKSFGGEVMMTSPSHQSGTDRCGEVLEKMKEAYDIVINVQGDEPFINPAQIDALAACFSDRNVSIATQAKRIKDSAELFNPNVVKVISDRNADAFYFSRQALPFIRGKEEKDWLPEFTFFKHIGIYAFRTEVLPLLTKLAPSALEKAESLEQLRWLENGYKIRVNETEFENISIDTPEDLLHVEKILKTNPEL